MGVRIELPEDFVYDLEQVAVRRHVSVIEIMREALRIWQANRPTPEIDRKLVMQVLQDKRFVCQLPAEHVARALPLTIAAHPS